MIIASAQDYRKAAKSKLPRFLFQYIEGGSYTEQTLRSNIIDLEKILFRQRILQNVEKINFEVDLFGQNLAIPMILSPVGITGLYARRGEVQVAKAADRKGIPFTLSTVSVCSIEEVSSQTKKPIWFQLYVLKDRGFMKSVLERAQAAGIKNLVFTVDMGLPGARYGDEYSGMSGPFAASRRILQAMTKPSWAFDVGILGHPLSLGNISTYLGKKASSMTDYMGWLNKNFDPTIGWSDFEWIRDFWKGPLIIKGILDPDDAKDAYNFGADGVVVSNHGGRQLDGVVSTAKALPKVVDAVGDKMTVLADSGVRSGLDVLRMLALGAKAVMIGRPSVYALAAKGQTGVEHLIDIFSNEMRIAMTLMGLQSITDINQSNLEY